MPPDDLMKELAAMVAESFAPTGMAATVEHGSTGYYVMVRHDDRAMNVYIMDGCLTVPDRRGWIDVPLADPECVEKAVKCVVENWARATPLTF